MNFPSRADPRRSCTAAVLGAAACLLLAPAVAGQTGGSGTPGVVGLPTGQNPSSGGDPSSGGATGAGQGGGNPTFDPDHWAMWWSYNREPILDLKRFVHTGSASSGGAGFYLGRGEQAGPVASLRPTNAQLHDEIVPALLHALETERYDQVQSAALIALAKIGDRPQAEQRLADVLRPYLKHARQQVSESAVLALGILADEREALLLVELLRDSREGRKAMGGGRVPYRTRAFAAYGLGLIGYRTGRPEVRQYIVHNLSRALDSDVGPTQDIEIACVLSLGLLPLPRDGGVVRGDGGKLPVGGSLAATIRRLADVFRDDSRDVLVRAHLPVSMARLAAAGDEALRAEVAQILLPTVERFARPRRETLQGAVIALGLIGDASGDEIDLRIRRELMRVADKEDPLTRSLAFVSLGRLASRPVPDSGEGLAEVRSFLLTKLERESGVRRAWAGIALAVLERGQAGAGGSPSQEVSTALHAALKKAASLDEAGGLCIALGMAKVSQAAPDLLDRLERWDEDYAQANAAIGLGLMEANQAVEALRAVLDRSKFRPILIRGAAISLALLRDKNSVPDLVNGLAEAGSVSSQGAIATALGSIGDQRSVDALLTLLRDKKATSLARAYAAVGLGIVGDKEPFPWNAKLAVDVNYNAVTETLTDRATGRGVLDVL